MSATLRSYYLISILKQLATWLGFFCLFCFHDSFQRYSGNIFYINNIHIPIHNIYIYTCFLLKWCHTIYKILYFFPFLPAGTFRKFVPYQHRQIASVFLTFVCYSTVWIMYNLSGSLLVDQMDQIASNILLLQAILLCLILHMSKYICGTNIQK